MLLIRKQEGFTLMELLAALAILAFVFGAIFSLYLSGLNSWNRGIDQMEWQQITRFSMDKMIRELRYASALDTPSDGEIRFYLKGDPLTYRFRLSGRELIFESIKKNGTINSHNKVALNITALSFFVDQTNTVHITLSAGTDTGSVTLAGSVQPRNMP